MQQNLGTAFDSLDVGDLEFALAIGEGVIETEFTREGELEVALGVALGLAFIKSAEKVLDKYEGLTLGNLDGKLPLSFIICLSPPSGDISCDWFS